MNVLIAGADFANKGGEAMVLTVNAFCKNRWPGCEVLVACSERDHGRACREGLVPVKNVTMRSRWRAVSFYRTVRALAGGVGSWDGWWGKPDAPRLGGVLDVSGFRWYDRPGRGPVGWLTEWARARAEGARGIPRIYLPQAWGPFRRFASRFVTRKVLSNASLVFARDKDSLAWVTGLRALAPDRLRLAADIAFQFTGSSPERAAEVLEKAGARLDGTPLVGITPNMRVYERTEGKGFENRYVRALSDLCGFFTRQEGCQVVLIPHEISPNTDRKDDRFLGQLVSSLVPGDAARVCVLTDAHSAADLKAVIGQCVFLVGSRYHSLVAALSQRIPAVALGWAHKYEGLMMSAGLGQYVLDLGRNGVEGVSEVVQTAWSRRGLLKALLDSSVPRLEGSALGALEFAARIIEEGMERDV